MTPPNEHTSEGGRDDRGVPYHAKSIRNLNTFSVLDEGAFAREGKAPNTFERPRCKGMSALHSHVGPEAPINTHRREQSALHSTSALHSQAEALLSSPYPVCSVLLRLRLQALAAALARDANVLANLSGQDATCITTEEISFERESLVTAASAANTLVKIAARSSVPAV